MALTTCWGIAHWLACMTVGRTTTSISSEGRRQSTRLRVGAPATDLGGRDRVDDPGVQNTGSSDYFPIDIGANPFVFGGTRQNWRWNNTYIHYTLPFTFPFYGDSYTQLFVSTEGFLQFIDPSSADNGNNTIGGLIARRRIAALWDNLRTDGSNDDIFIDTSVAGQVTVRWNATNETDNSDVNFSITIMLTAASVLIMARATTTLRRRLGYRRGTTARTRC